MGEPLAMNSVVAFKQKSLGLHGTLSTEVAKGSCAISSPEFVANRGAEPRRAETSHRPGTGGSESADERQAAQYTQEALPANRGRVNSATQTYERPDSAEMPTAPLPIFIDAEQRIGDRNANHAVSGRVTDCGNTPVCDPAPAGDGRSAGLLRRHGDLRTFLETGAVRSVEVANRGAAPRRAEKPSPGKATVEREQGRPLTEMSPAPLPILEAKDSAMPQPEKAWSADRGAASSVHRVVRANATSLSPTAPRTIFIDAEPLSRNVVGEAVGEFVTGVFIVAILCPTIWAFCLLIRYLGARFHL